MALSAWSTVKDAVTVVRGNLRSYLGTAGVPIIVGVVLGGAFSIFLFQFTLKELAAAVAYEDTGSILRELIPAIVIAVGIALAQGFLSTLGFAMGIVVTARRATSETADWDTVWARVWPRMWNLLATMLLLIAPILLLAALLVGITLLAPAASLPVGLVIVLAIIVALWYVVVAWSLAPVVSLLEAHKPLENLKQSASLTRGSRRAVMLAFLLVFGVSMIPGLITTLAFTPEPIALDAPDPVAAMHDAAPTPGQQVLATAVTLVLGVPIGFVVTATTTLLYLRLRPARESDAAATTPPTTLAS